MSEHSAEKDAGQAKPLRWFLDGCEITQEQAEAFERQGRAKIVRGGSGVVPEEFRQPGETREQWLSPWGDLRSTMLLAATRVLPPGASGA